MFRFERRRNLASGGGSEGASTAPSDKMASDFILETEGLTKEFRGFLAVNGVNLRVRHWGRSARESSRDGRAG